MKKTQISSAQVRDLQKSVRDHQILVHKTYYKIISQETQVHNLNSEPTSWPKVESESMTEKFEKNHKKLCPHVRLVRENDILGP